jgi:tetratricopeptide (TPR) repeat protein
MDDGTPPPVQVAVQTLCRGEKRTVAHTDPQGKFSFTLIEQKGGAGSSDANVPDASNSGGRDGLPIGDSANPLSNMREWRKCAVQAELAGFKSETVDIISRTDNWGGNIGSIKLSRIAQVQGLTISATSAAAPENAKQAFEKGLVAEKKNKLDAALELFNKAVEAYPQYAVAWSEIGRVQMMKGDVAAAKHSFSKSLDSDSQYVNPYLGLTQIALQQQKWQETADLTLALLNLNPVNFPNAWFYNGYANYNLGNLADAEKSARAGLKVDSEHHYPKLEYLLGVTLLEKKDYASASEHLQNFLHMATDPREVAEVKKQLEEAVRLSTATNSGVTSDKK